MRFIQIENVHATSNTLKPYNCICNVRQAVQPVFSKTLDEHIAFYRTMFTDPVCYAVHYPHIN